ncbi:MAG TPA: hypothetical protein VMS63_01515 [Gaiellaceae bacterium]|nr:hypothetical protein [Gaiellaceae bacterium]
MDGTSTAGTRYRLVVRGELGSRFASVFEGMQIEHLAGMTVITGRVIDQAHLFGLLERMPELGIELVSVEPIDETAADVPTVNGGRR